MSSRLRYIVFIVLLILTICIVLRECIAYLSFNYGFFQYESKNTLLRHEKSYYNLFPNSSSSESWSPFKVNESCPIFAVESDRKLFLKYITIKQCFNIAYSCRWLWRIWRSVWTLRSSIKYCASTESNCSNHFHYYGPSWEPRIHQVGPINEHKYGFTEWIYEVQHFS